MADVLTPDPGREFTLEFLLAQLRALRLFRLAEEMPSLLEEAAKDGWGQLGLLSEIFRREGLRLSQRRFERNMKASGLNESYGIDHFNFELALEHGVSGAVVRDLVQCEFLRARRNIILAGGVGTGKTYLAKTIGVEALKRGFKVFFFNTANLLDMIHSKRNSFQFGKVYARIRDVDLIVLDDLAYLPYSAEKVEYLFSLVVDRYELKTGSAIVTSNTDVMEWWRFFPSKAMGMAFSDRLLDGAQGIRLGGESIRGPHGKPKDTKPPGNTPKADEAKDGPTDLEGPPKDKD